MTDPTSVYLEMKGELQKVLGLPLEGKKEQFREFLVGHLMVECNYPESKARRLVTGNEEAILAMIVESKEGTGDAESRTSHSHHSIVIKS